MDSAQSQGRIQVARSLALPRYHADDEMNELAREMYRLERQVSKDIMYVVAESTTRSDNWRGVIGEGVSALGSDKMRVIDEIQI